MQCFSKTTDFSDFNTSSTYASVKYYSDVILSVFKCIKSYKTISTISAVQISNITSPP